MNKILKRTQNAFNVSVAQVGDLDNHTFAEIGFAMAGNESRYINGKMEHLLSFIDELNVAEILGSKIEIMVVSDFLQETLWEKGKYDEF